MQKHIERFGAMPYVLLGISLFFIGFTALEHLTTNIWLFDPQQRPDLARDLALGRATSTALLEAANQELIFTFLAIILGIVAGISLPLVYYLNKRFTLSNGHYLIILRQAMWVGVWASFCTWLQMHRALTWSLSFLILAMLLLFELLLQIRGRALFETQGLTHESP